MAEAELRCENCNQLLDPTDKFCRECGLPTVRRAETQKLIPTLPPDMDEMKRALDAVPDPKPFLRASADPELEPEPAQEEPAETPTTGSIVRATSPTFVANLASSTLLMVGVITFLALAGIAFIVLAFR